MQVAQQYCTFKVDQRLFGIEVSRVQEVIRPQEMTPVPLSATAIRGLINLRGQIVTAIDLRRRLALPENIPGPQLMNVVVKTSEGAVSFLVDEIGDVMELTSENYEKPPETLKGPVRELIRGTYKLKNELLLILDTDRVLDRVGK
jgi:purine-binding chemotaxis protein CheW